MAIITRVCSVLTLVLLVQDVLCRTTTFGQNLQHSTTTEIITTTGTDIEDTTEVVASTTASADTVREETTSQEDRDFGIRYYLYTRDHPVSYVELGNASLLRDTDFDTDRPTMFVIHGFTGSGETTSVTLIKDALLYTEDVNVVSLHWEDLAKGPDYEVAANNAAIAAEHLAKTIERLVTEENVSLQSLHVIGFSLGAQVAGIAGSLLTIGKLPRITGLDPAGPIFQQRSDEKRLDASDADFVVVLHTSGGFVSFEEPLGHADFYPNGGRSPQPACEDEVVKLVCSHLIAPLYFVESIYKPQAFAAVKCDSWLDYTEGLCPSCQPVFLGLHTPPSARGMFFLRTSAQEPYGLGTGAEIKDNNVDGGDRREGRTVGLEDETNDLKVQPDVQAKGSSGPKPLAVLLLAACIAFVRS